MKPQLKAALADVGVTEQDWRDIKKAQAIVDQVNARLAARGAGLMYAVMAASAQPIRTEWPAEITE